MRSALALLIAGGLSLSACGSEGDASETSTVGFLRAVATSDQGALFRELRSAGFIEGENLEVRPSDPEVIHPDPEDARSAAEDWVRRGVDVIFAFSSTGAMAAAEATSEVPIVFLVNDPVAVGLLGDRDRPEANLTGVTFRVPADRTLNYARQAVGGLSRIGFLYPSEDPAAVPHRDAVVSAGADLGIDVVIATFGTEDEVAGALDALVEQGAPAVVVANAPIAIRMLPAIEAAAAERGLPLIANVDLAPTAVVALTPDVEEVQAQVARQAIRLLRGSAVGDVPVEDPRRFRLILNAARARELGLPPLPDALVRQADEVLQ